MAKPPKTDSGKIPQIDDAEVKAAQERLKARIEDSKKRDEARQPSEKPSSKKVAKPKTPKKPKSPKSGVSIGTVALCSLLAAGIGGAIGWLGPQYFGGAENSAVMAQLQSRVTAAEAQIKSQKQSLTATQSDASRVSEIDGLRAQMRTVSGAVDENAAAIERAASQRSDLAARMDVTEAMLGEDGATKPSIVLERIDAIEATVTEMAARPVTEAAPKGLVITAPSVISYETAGTAKTAEVKEGIKPDASATAVEANPITAQITPAPSAPKVADYDFIGNFPRAAMLAAVESDAAPTESKNWFKRKLDEHMQSGASEAQNARRDITRAEQLTQRGDIAAAVNLIKRQSPAVQKSAKAWLTAAEAQINAQE